MKTKTILNLMITILCAQKTLIANPEDSKAATSSLMETTVVPSTQNFIHPDQQPFSPEIDIVYLKEIKQLKYITQKKFEKIEYLKENSHALKNRFPEYTDALNRIEHIEGTIILEFFPENPEERVKQFERVIDQYKKIDKEYSDALSGMESFYN